MTGQTLIGQTWNDQTELWAGLDERREVLNTQLPTRCLDGQAPLEAYPTARQSGRAYQPQWEEDLLDVDRVYAYLAQGRWFRQVRANGSMRIGGYYYALGRRYADRTTEITFDATTASFLCRPEGTDQVLSVPMQGLSKADLMGELAGLVRLPTYQLALPLSTPACRQQIYASCLEGTTL
jgi:hypothetical protein